MTSATTRRARVDAVLAELRERFPDAFPADLSTVRPLALGVREGIEASGTVPSRTTLHRALWRWCRQPEYLQAIAEGRPRINLDGTDAGPVAPEHQAAAAAWLEKLRAKAGRVSAVVTPVAPAAPVPEPAPEPAPVAPTGRPVLTLKHRATVTKRKPT